MNSIEESFVSRTAIDALLEESDSKIEETIRGLKDFLVNIDGAVRKFLPLAVSSLGTDNEALLIPANILPNHNAQQTKICFKTCYKSEGKSLISNYLTAVQEAVNEIRQDLASKTALFEDAQSFLKRYRQVVTRSRVIRAEANNIYGDDNKNFAVDDGLIYEANSLSARDSKNIGLEMTQEYDDFGIPTDPLIDESSDNTDKDMNSGKYDNVDSRSKKVDELPELDESRSSGTDNKKPSSSADSDILFSSSIKSSAETNLLVPKSNVRNSKVREGDLDYLEPSHYESFRNLMGKQKIKNANAKKQFKAWLLEQIQLMAGNDLTGRTKEILQVDKYFIRLKIHYNMSFEDVCKKFVRFFPVAFRYTSEEWNAMVSEASRDSTSKRARFSQKDLYQLYDMKK